MAVISACLTAGSAAAYPTINLVQDCGAKGDGKSDDTAAFQQAAQRIQAAGGGTLVIPKAVYMVGGQTHVEGKTPYYQTPKIFQAAHLRYLWIKGQGATVKSAPGQHFGAFDPKTGAAHTAMPDYDPQYAVGVGVMFDLSASRNITVQDLDLDGSSGSYVLGGGWGDTGRQLSGEGLRLYGDTDVQIRHVHSHHQGLDGIMIGWTGLKASDPPTPHTLADCVFDFNGRQGLSWVGGLGLHAVRCRFNHTGRTQVNGTVLESPPGAGVDIEAEDSVCRGGDFENCEFVDNAGCGMVADSGDGGYARFRHCTFWGTTNWSAWSAKPGLKYEDCTFYGSAVHTFGSPDPALATTFTRCHFEDKPWKNGQVYGNYLLDTDSGGQNVHLDGCTFVVHSPKHHPYWFNQNKPIMTK